MPFVELHPDQPVPDTLPPRSRLDGPLSLVALPAIFLFNLCPPLARLFGERTTHVESDGWLAEWTTARLLCPYCGARVRRFEFAGRPVPIPPCWNGRYPPGPAPSFATPVGVFMPWKGRWRRGHWEPPAYVARGTFAPEDQRQGGYVTEWCDVDGQPVPTEAAIHRRDLPVHRKSGTPADWCLLEGAHPHWLDPRRHAEVVNRLAADADDAPTTGSATP